MTFSTAQPVDSAGSARVVHKRRLTRVALATTIGTAIEAFDFLAFGTAAALVFNPLFFPRFDSTAAGLASFAAFATGLFARPVGAVMFGHFGDRVGRKRMLALSLVGMGAATVLIGLLPTYCRSIAFICGPAHAVFVRPGWISLRLRIEP